MFRIRTERSSATIPDTRTNHHISNVEVVEQNDKTVKLRFNWHTMSALQPHRPLLRHELLHLDVRCEPADQGKKVVLKTDYIRHVIDVYHIRQRGRGTARVATARATRPNREGQP